MLVAPASKGGGAAFHRLRTLRVGRIQAAARCAQVPRSPVRFDGVRNPKDPAFLPEPDPHPLKQRKQKLIVPRIQIRLVGMLVGISAVAMLLQFLFLGARLMGKLADLEGPGGQLAEEVPMLLLLQVFGLSIGVLLPVIFGLGIVVTFRVAGPIHRFEQYLRGVARGDQLGPCRIREGDQLQSLCDAINEATEPLRRRQPQVERLRESA